MISAAQCPNIIRFTALSAAAVRTVQRVTSHPGVKLAPVSHCRVQFADISRSAPLGSARWRMVSAPAAS